MGSMTASGPQAWHDLVDHCNRMPATAGYMAGYSARTGDGILNAITLACWDWSPEDVCAALLRGIEAYAAQGPRVYWRRLPSLTEVNGTSNSDVFGDQRYGLQHVIMFKRPYFVASARLAVPGATEMPDLCKAEGHEVLGPVSSRERDAAVGTASAWFHRNWLAGEIIGPPPPDEMIRPWHARFPEGAIVLNGITEKGQARVA